MTVRLVSYLNFAGNAAEAMRYYQGIFGGELTIATFGEYGAEGMPADGTMHAELTGEVLTLMASDAMPGAEQTWGGTRIYLSLTGDANDPLSDWFDRLAADGSVGMPLEKQVWGDTYGLVKDKYGFEWMVNISDAQPS